MKAALKEAAHYRLARSRQAAHVAFDLLWKEKHMTRSEAYTWLAEQLGLPKDRTHMVLFDEAQCEKVCRVSAEKLLTFRTRPR